LDEATIAKLEADRLRQRQLRTSRAATRFREFRSLISTRYRRAFLEWVDRANVQLNLRLSDSAIADTAGELMAKAINEFHRNALGFYLPEAAILAELFTLWERGQKRFTVNDYNDWQHAVVALPLCNIFMTESHLASQLRQLGADNRYGCQVFSSADEAVAAMI
jgi:hypothetical protein